MVAKVIEGQTKHIQTKRIHAAAPLLIDNAMDVPVPTNRNEWLHCTQHARTIKKKCESVGSPCIVVKDEKNARPDARAFLMKFLNLVSSWRSSAVPQALPP